MGNIMDTRFNKVNEVIDGMEVSCSSIANTIPNYRLIIDGKLCIDSLEPNDNIQLIAYDKDGMVRTQGTLPIQLRGTECYSYLFCNYLRTHLMNRLPHATIETREKIVKLFSEFAHKEYIERKLVYQEVAYTTYVEAMCNVDDVLKKLNDEPNKYFLADNCIYLTCFKMGQRYMKLELEECVTSVMNLMILDIHGEKEIKYSVNSMVKIFVSLFCNEVGATLIS